MQFRLVPGYHQLLIDGIEWQAGNVLHHGGSRSLGPFVRVVDSIKDGRPVASGLVLTEIADEDLEIATGAMEAYYAHTEETLFVDHEGCINLIQMLRNAEDICCLAVGKKPATRESLPVVHEYATRRR